MFRFRKEPQLSDRIVPIALGATAGLAAAAGVYLLRRTGRLARGAEAAQAGLIDLEERIVDRLAADEIIGARAVEVAALSDGIVELTGSVRDDEEADRAVRLAQATPGVRTVLNRLDVEILEDHLADTRERFFEGDPALTETRWTGIGVGMGRRRQGWQTEPEHTLHPERADQKAFMVERALGVDRAVEQTSEPLDKIPPAVEGHTVGNAAPSDHGLVDDVTHHRLGNVGEESLQDFNAIGQVIDNVKPGTELDIEQADAPGVRREVTDEMKAVRRDLNAD